MADSNTRRWELDTLRGFAVLGIFWVNIVYFGWPFDAKLYPVLFGGSRALNEWSWGFIHLLVEGAMFALFSLLFGASALMLLDERRLGDVDGVRAVDLYYRRKLWLIAFGALHAFVLLWPLEILFTYGVLGLVLFPLRRLKATTLLIAGTAMLVWGASPPLQVLLTPLPKPTAEMAAPAGQAPPAPLTDRQLLEALGDDIDSIGADMALYHGDYRSIFRGNFDVAVGQQTVNLYEDNLWDAGGMMLVGMALFKWGILTGARSLAFYLAMTLIGFGLAILLRLPAVSVAIASGFDPDRVYLVNSLPNLLGRLPLALGYVGLILLLCRWERLRGLTRSLGAAGRMALTNYVGQTGFSLVVFYGFGFGLFGRFPYYQLILISMLFGAFQVLLSVHWLRYFHQGPLEWLWRSLVQRRLQPFRRAQRNGVSQPPLQVSRLP